MDPATFLPIHEEEEYNNTGQQLLGYLRTLEKHDDAETDNQTAERALKALLRKLKFLIPCVARKGLFHGNVELAEELVSSSADQRFDRSSRKRGKKRTSGSSLFMDVDIDQPRPVASTGTLLCAEQIVACIIRILGCQQHEYPNSLQSKALDGLTLADQRLLMLLASDLCTAASTFVQSRRTSVSSCGAAEYQLLASNAKSLLMGLARSMDCILSSANIASTTKTFSYSYSQDTIPFPVEDARPLALLALKACHRASVSLVSLMGTGLSRMVTQINYLTAVGVWKAFSIMNSCSVEYATLLNATIVGAGPTGGTKERLTKSGPNTEQWSASLQESVALLFVLLQSAVPINSTLADRTQHHENRLDQNAAGKAAVDVWLQRIRDSSGEERSSLFLHCLRVLVSMAISLLSMEGGNCLSLAAEVDVVSILDLVEILMSFPISAESLYFGTKKRLRQETFESGLFSPEDVAYRMANQVKIQGHDLLNALLSLGRPVLLPFAHRLLKTCFGALLTSSSTALRSALESKAGPSKLDLSRKRWLNSSVVVRTAALRSVQSAFLVVGVDHPCSKRSSSLGLKKSGDTDRLVTLLCGCLVEQLQWLMKPQDRNDDWGSVKERTECLVAVGDCLDACLVGGGPFLSNVQRSLIDSATKSLLLKCTLIQNDNNPDISLVYNCALSLGIQSCSTPWSDGAACCLESHLRETAERLQKMNVAQSVVHSSLAAIRLCDTIEAPRVPALNIVSTMTHTTKPRIGSIADVLTMENRLREISSLRSEALSLNDEGTDEEGMGSKKPRLKVESDGQNHKPVETRALKDPPSSQNPTPSADAHAPAAQVQSLLDQRDSKSDKPQTAVVMACVPATSTDLMKGSLESCEELQEISDAQSESLVVGQEPDSQPVSSYRDCNSTIGKSASMEPSFQAKSEQEEETEEDDIPMIFDAPPDEEDE